MDQSVLAIALEMECVSMASANALEAGEITVSILPSIELNAVS
jgi:hypothetical protein